MIISTTSLGPAPAERSQSDSRLGPVEYHFPCTPAQQSLWFADRLSPGNPAFNVAVRLRIQGPLNRYVLERAINVVAERHETLRTTFLPVEGEPVQAVHKAASIALPCDDLSSFVERERHLQEELRTMREAQTPFDLRAGPLLRVRLLRLVANEHVLLLTMHHIISDGWSIGVFSKEACQAYADLAEGRSPNLPALSIQYADYAVWRRDCAAADLLESDRSYWRRKLARLPVCELPADFPRPRRRTYNAYILSELLPVDLTDELMRFAAAHHCTMHTVCLAALKMLIARHTRQTDVHVGSLVAGRDRAEIEPLIGLFVNTLVLRTSLSGDPRFGELLLRVRNTLDEALEHRALHFQGVVEAVRPARDPSRPVLCSISFIYQRDFVKPIEFAGLAMTPMPSVSPGAIYDLNFFMVRRSDGWRLSCEYNTDLYEPETISRLLAELRGLFRQIPFHPEQHLSQFRYAADACEPLPEFVPRRKSHSS